MLVVKDGKLGWKEYEYPLGTLLIYMGKREEIDQSIEAMGFRPWNILDAKSFTVDCYKGAYLFERTSKFAWERWAFHGTDVYSVILSNARVSTFVERIVKMDGIVYV